MAPSGGLARCFGMPSTVIRSFAYHPALAALDVEFVSGRRYRYADVPEEVAAAFRAAFSKGRFFNARIRDRYRCVELAPEPEEWSEEWA
jgi:lysyl-tRNA synthetase class 2